MQVTIDETNKKITIVCEIDEKPSKSGKMILLAGSGGFKPTGTQYKDKEVKINLNIGISSK